MTRHRPPHVFSIPPGEDFLPTLAAALLDGQLVEGFSCRNDPLRLADVTIFLPTRRAARALRMEFARQMGGEATLLPNIRPLGDVSDDEWLESQTEFTAADDLGSPEAIPPLERQLLLTRLIMGWADALQQADRELYQDEAIAVPATLSDAAWLAGDLAALMDAVSLEETNWSRLADLVEAEHAGWWQLTLAFLKVATEQWPKILQERNTVDLGTKRNGFIRRQAEHFKMGGARGPVIAAGSTGSIPATAELLKIIARLPQGAVVLPGLDRTLDEETFERLDSDDGDGTAPGHPQFGLKILLKLLGIARKDVRILAENDQVSEHITQNTPLFERELLVSEALRPSFSTHRWHTNLTEKDHSGRQMAFEKIALIEAPAERQEAAAIALAMREVLQTADKTAALVTPDRDLARRVASELKRYGIRIDDSAGSPLRNSSAGSFVRLILQIAFVPYDPVTLISLLKHPLAAFGMEPAKARQAARLLELVLIRGIVTPPRPGDLYDAVVESRNDTTIPEYRRPPGYPKSDDQWELLQSYCTEIDAVFANVGLPENSKDILAIEALISLTVNLTENCAADNTDSLDRLYGTDSGEALGKFLDALIQVDGCAVRVVPAEWPSLFDALLADKVVRPKADTHPRLAIWGPLEARLQSVDRVVLGGLNEASWPSTGRNDPFLSRPMKLQMDLDPPERRIGLAAHDFQMLLGKSEVILSRAERSGADPTVASRWLQRLKTICGETVTREMSQRGRQYLGWVNTIDFRHGAQPIIPIAQPNPKPPVTARPKGLSITDIETWIRDPYAIYAKHVLKLSPQEPLSRSVDARERGTLYHAIMEKFVKERQSNPAACTLQHLLDIARNEFTRSALPEEIAMIWWPRFEEIATDFIQWEADRSDRVAKSFVEISASTAVAASGFKLKGRADRIDVLTGGGIEIIDYKTGTNPSASQAASLVVPQLPLEGAVAQNGGFAELPSGMINELIYVRLRASKGFSADNLSKAKTVSDIDALCREAWRNLQQIIETYQDPSQGYLSRARPFKEGSFDSDYDHLARVREWSLGESGDDGEEGSE